MAALRETEGYIQAVGSFAGRAYSEEGFDPSEHLRDIRAIVEEYEGFDEQQNELIIQEVVTGLQEIVQGLLPARDEQGTE